jgi:serine/threonine protein kinase
MSEFDLTCDACGAEVLDIDVKCPECGERLTSTGAHRLIGTFVLGQYEIVDILGQGGMSVVYKGRHKLTEQLVALKILPPELAAHSQVKSRFLEEAKALAALDHPNIVHLYNFGQENGCFVLAMQFVEGDTWERIILENECQPWHEAGRIACDVLRALEYAHTRGVVHRDMKPSNVLVRDSDRAATVMDFGIAKMTTSTKLTATGQTMGTVRYMSPEQVRGQSVDLRTDIYSLGATLYEAVVGDTPFDGETHFEIMTKHLNEPPRPPTALGIHMPLEFEEALMRALSKRADDRWESARDLRKAIEGCIKSSDVGHAETQRLSRDIVTPKRPASSAPTTAAESAQVEGLASTLEPTESEVVYDGARSAKTSGRPRLWIALAAIVAVASTGVAWVLARGGGDDGDRVAETKSDARATRDKPVKKDWPDPFIPPGVKFDVDKEYADDKIRIRAPEGWDADGIRRAYTAAYARFEAFLRQRDLAGKVVRPPVSIMIVPRHALCDERNYERKKEVPSKTECERTELHYRPSERTLFLINKKTTVDYNIDYGVALAVCLHTPIDGCGAALDDFVAGQ